MDKTAIKNFAIWARNALIRNTKDKCGLVGIQEDGIQDPLPQSTADIQFFDAGTGTLSSITGMQIPQRDALVQKIREKERDSDYLTAYNYIVEQVAYTWFNRLIAIRFMEVNDYLPSRIRVLSSEQAGKLEPDILATPFDAEFDFTTQEREAVIHWKDRGQKEDMDALFRLLFVKQCDALHEILPNLFQKVDGQDYTELLLNISFTDRDGVVYRLVNDIPESNFDVSQEGQVEIIGWLYQYYNTDLNALVYDGSMSKSRITKELLPAATTIYTPDWAIKYMVENSLGRLWVEGHPNDGLKENWRYYLEEAEQEPEVQAQLAEIRQEYAELNPEDIKVIDPCMGSGHILVYAFDVLMQIYESQGYTQRDAAQSILANNLFGLDIDERATQLAYFAVMMKARQYDRRILTRGIRPHVLAIQESNGIHRAHLDYFGAGMSDLEKNTARMQLEDLLETLRDAKEYGSILRVENCKWDLLRRFVAGMDVVSQITLDSIGVEDTAEKLMRLIDVGQALVQEYDVVITNPPYLGSSRFSPKLNSYVVENYPDVKADLSMVMYKHALRDLCRKNGFVSFIATTSWMFLSSFEKLRNFALTNYDLESLVDFGTELFEGKVGHNPIAAWVNRKSKVDYTMIGIRLVDYCYSRRDEKEQEFFNKKNYHYPKQSNFSKIPGSPVAYWLPLKIFELYSESTTMETVAHPKVGMQTSNNDKYLRLWFEINYAEFNGSSLGLKWIKYLKGGAYRKWYGNLEYLLFYNYNPEFILQQQNARVLDQSYLRMKKCTWTDLTSGNNSFRLPPDDTFYDISGHCFFPDSENQLWLLAYANTKIFSLLKQVFNSTFHCQVGDVAKIVVPKLKSEEKAKIESLSEENVLLSKSDWDAFETSWDFKRHPLV